MAHFLFCSLDAALITDLAWQVHGEGHDVNYYIEAESDQEIGDGFVPTTDDWEREVEWADVIIFDDIRVGPDVGTGQLARELRNQGKAVVGGTPNTDRLEGNRGYAMEILEEHGVNTIEPTSSMISTRDSARPGESSSVRDQAARRGSGRQTTPVCWERRRWE